MTLPFSVEQFFDVFRRYNEGVWPAQWILAAVGLVAIYFATRDSVRAGRAVSAALAALWLWMGVVYHFAFFRVINPAAVLFGTLFVAQGVMLAWFGVWRGRLRFEARADFAGAAGALLVVAALLVYPAIGYALGHRYPVNPTFGLPCPTTVFTLGLLSWLTPRAPRVVLIIPLLWALIGGTAALQLGVREDLMLPGAALLATAAWLARRTVARRYVPRLTRA